MKNPDPRHILNAASFMLKLGKLVSSSSINTVFPFYHAISDDPAPHLRHLYKIKSINEFEADLDILLKYYEVLSPVEINERVFRKDSNPGFLLTFDDGLSEIYFTIAPILKKKGIPAIFFLNNAFIDNLDLFYRYKVSLLVDRLIKEPHYFSKLSSDPEFFAFKKVSIDYMRKTILSWGSGDINKINKACLLVNLDIDNYLKSEKPYMTTSQIEDLISEGFYIGAHSFEHPDFSTMEPVDQLVEIERSTEEIKKKFSLDYNYFAFPFSDYGVSPAVIKKALSKTHLLFGTAGFRITSLQGYHQRLSMEKYNGDAGKILKTEYYYYKLKEWLFIERKKSGKYGN